MGIDWQFASFDVGNVVFPWSIEPTVRMGGGDLPFIGPLRLKVADWH